MLFSSGGPERGTDDAFFTCQGGQEPPRFLIESVVVEGVPQAAGRRIVSGETLLKMGQTYTERELRQAVYRVRRLPFVVNAESTLRKGEHDGYELVIPVVEETPVFLSAGTNGQRGGPELALQHDG